MFRRKYIEIISIACTYTGTVIGAGFASGQEILQFFIAYGGIGLAGIIAAGFLFALLGHRLLILAWDIEAASFKDILAHLYGQKLGKLMEMITSLSLFGIFTVMLAGAGTLAAEYFITTSALITACCIWLSCRL